MAPAGLKKIALLGFAATLVVCLASVTRGWPFPSLTSEPWFYQFNATSAVTRYGLLAVFFAGVAGMAYAWKELLSLSRREEIPLRSLAWIFVLWATPICLSVPLFSGDVYVYYVDGENLARGFNPYDAGISAMGSSEVVHMIHPLWRTTTTMYGPLFIRLTHGIAELSGGNVIAGVLMLRALALVAVVASALSVVSIAKRLQRPAAPAVVFAILNPLTLMHLVGGAHNDAAMLGFLLAGFAVGLKADRLPLRVLALSLCVFGAQFKAPAFAGVFVLAWMWSGPGTGLVKRIINVAVASGFSLALFQLVTTLTGLGWAWVEAADVPGLAHPLLSPPNALAFAIGEPFGLGFVINGFTRTIATVGSVLGAIWLIVRLGPHASNEQILRASGWALLLVAWLGPAVYPWYLVWGVSIVGTVGARKLHGPLVWAVIAVSFAIAPGGYGMLDTFDDWGRWITALLTTAAFVWVVFKVVKPRVSLTGPQGTFDLWFKKPKSDNPAQSHASLAE